MPPRRQRPKESPALIAFGGQMRRMREGKKITQQSIADHVNISKGQVSRIENGTRRATRSFVEAVDRLLEADGALIKLWTDLNRNGHPVPIWFDWPVRHEALHNRVEMARIAPPIAHRRGLLEAGGSPSLET